METSNFLAWFLVVGAIAAFAVFNMGWAYLGSGSTAVLFTEPVNPTPLPSDAGAEVVELFQQGVSAFQRGNYRRAIDRFSQAVRRDPQLAEAYHNGGLSQANLRQDNDAAQSLAKAAALYLDRGNRDAIEQIKTQLDCLKNRKK